MKKHALKAIAVLAGLSVMVAGCGSAGSTGNTSGNSTGTSAKKSFTIGIANGYIGNSWRTQMIDDMQQVAQTYEQQGVISKVVVQNADNNVSQQISQIQNMINSGVNCILVDPVSATALVPVIHKAQAAGILVIPFDGVVNDDKVTNVTTDQYAWAQSGAEWLAQQLNGTGDIIMVDGLAGVPANTIRVQAVKDVLKKYPGIKVVQEVNGNWDEAKSEQAMTSLISSYPNISGIYTQDTMGMGLVQAYQAAHKKVPLMTGDTNKAYFQFWMNNKDSGFNSFVESNPPGIGATALEIAVNLLQGKKLKDSSISANPVDPSEHNTILVKSPLTVTNTNVADVWNSSVKDKTDSYILDAWLTPDQVGDYFN